MYVYGWMDVCIDVCMCVYGWMCVCMYVRIYRCMYVCVCMDVCMYGCMCMVFEGARHDTGEASPLLGSPMLCMKWVIVLNLVKTSTVDFQVHGLYGSSRSSVC